MDYTRVPSFCDRSPSCGARDAFADVADAIHSQTNGTTLSDQAARPVSKLEAAAKIYSIWLLARVPPSRPGGGLGEPGRSCGPHVCDDTARLRPFRRFGAAFGQTATHTG